MHAAAADNLQSAFRYIDQGLIFFYRIFDNPSVGYFFGTCVLAMLCTVAGRLTLAASERVNAKRFSADNREMVRMHNLSLQALAARDKSAYQACNREANAAFGKYFFGRAAQSMAALWPVPFALAWLDTRFSGVDFILPVHLPGIGESVGYPFTFIPVYILARILVARLLPGPETGEAGQPRMLTLSDIVEPRQ